MPETRLPEELPAAEQALLAAYRRARAMPAPAKERMLQRLERPEVRGASTTRIVAAAVAVAAALVLAWGGSQLGFGAAEREPASETAAEAAMQRDGDEPSPRAHERTPATDHRAAPRNRDAAPGNADAGNTGPVPGNTDAVPGNTDAVPGNTDADPGNTDADPGNTAAKPGVSPKSTSSASKVTTASKSNASAAVESAVPQVDRERAILARAWAALADGDHASARAHAREFSTAILGVERDAIATIADCQGQRGGWSDSAQAFLATHGKTPLAGRVRTACGLEEDPAPLPTLPPMGGGIENGQ